MKLSVDWLSVVVGVFLMLLVKVGLLAVIPW